MVKIISIISLVLLLIACQGNPAKQVVTTRNVDMAVFQCPGTMGTSPVRPPLTVNSLTAAERLDYGKVAQAYRIDILNLMLYSEQLEQDSKAFRSVCSQ